MDARADPLVFVGRCIGKEPFTSPQAAQKVVRRMRKARKPGAEGVSVYRCPACGAFHIGNSVKSRHYGQASGRRARRRTRDENMV